MRRMLKQSRESREAYIWAERRLRETVERMKEEMKEKLCIDEGKMKKQAGMW